MADNQSTTPSSLADKIETARTEARDICDRLGSDSPDCAAAWDVVEELQATASDQQQAPPKKTAFESYCDDNPDAVECRIYED